MSTLTKQERDGLEDIFLSLGNDVQNSIFHKDFVVFKSLKNLIISINKAKVGVFESKFVHFMDVFTKKKKFLSK